MPFLLDNSFKDVELACYVIYKVTIGIVLLASLVFVLLSPSFNGSKTVIFGYSVLLQITPLGIRYLLLSDIGSKFIWYSIIFIVLLLIYVVLIFGLSAQNKKMNKRNEISKGNEIDIQSEKRLADDKSE